MLDGKKVLAIIPARGGSKGVIKKNIRLLAGKPLIAWTIEEAKRSKYIDKLILSSDDSEIIQIANNYGCEVPFVRPSHLAKDDTPGIDPVIHAIEYFPDFDYIVLLQPTSPLRSNEDIDKAIEICIREKVSSCVSVVKSDVIPYWMYFIDDTQTLSPAFPNKKILRRQDSPSFYMLNGAVYVATKHSLLMKKSFIQEDTKAYVMPKERSIDIDSYEDFDYCEVLLSNKYDV